MKNLSRFLLALATLNGCVDVDIVRLGGVGTAGDGAGSAPETTGADGPGASSGLADNSSGDTSMGQASSSGVLPPDNECPEELMYAVLVADARLSTTIVTADCEEVVSYDVVSAQVCAVPTVDGFRYAVDSVVLASDPAPLCSRPDFKFIEIVGLGSISIPSEGGPMNGREPITIIAGEFAELDLDGVLPEGEAWVFDGEATTEYDNPEDIIAESDGVALVGLQGSFVLGAE